MDFPDSTEMTWCIPHEVAFPRGRDCPLCMAVRIEKRVRLYFLILDRFNKIRPFGGRQTRRLHRQLTWIETRLRATANNVQ